MLVLNLTQVTGTDLKILCFLSDSAVSSVYLLYFSVRFVLGFSLLWLLYPDFALPVRCPERIEK